MKVKHLIILLILMFLFTPMACASEIVDNVEFLPESFLFEYNDHNSTNYEGDMGLKVAIANNSLDNKSYYIPTEYVRGIAYATKGSFKFKEAILISHGPLREWDNMYVMTNLKFKNGTIIPSLSIDDNDLTKEQREYFDDYYAQRSDYLAQQQEYAAEDLYDYAQVHSKYSGRNRYSYYYGSGGSGVIYTPGYGYY